jgi:hypothetical protein
VKHAAHASGRRRKQRAGQGGRLPFSRVGAARTDDAGGSREDEAGRPPEAQRDRPDAAPAGWRAEAQGDRPDAAPASGSPEDEPLHAREEAASPVGRGAGGIRRHVQVYYWAVLAVIAAGLLLLRGSNGQALRGGTFVIAGALLAGSVIRLALPEGRAGMLGSRRRLADTAVLTVLGIGLLIAGLTLPASG